MFLLYFWFHIQSEMVRAENGEPLYQISIYHLGIMKVIRTLSIENPTTALVFSNDGEILVTMSCDDFGNYLIKYWKWLKLKCIAMATVTERITKLGMNPQDATQISLSGPNYFKFMRLNPHDDNFKTISILSGMNAEVRIP